MEEEDAQVVGEWIESLPSSRVPKVRFSESMPSSEGESISLNRQQSNKRRETKHEIARDGHRVLKEYCFGKCDV